MPQKQQEFHFNVYTRNGKDGWEGFAVEQHSGTVIHKGDTEQELLDNMRNDFASTIANCMSIKSFFDFDGNRKHQYPINYRLAEKQDIDDFQHTTLTVTHEDIMPYKKDMKWLADTVPESEKHLIDNTYFLA